LVLRVHLPDGRRAFRSTGQRDRKKASDVCRTLERTREKARAGELSRSAARKLFDNLLENIGENPLSRETASSFFASWLAGKQIAVKPGVYKIYRKTVTKFLSHLGDKALKSLNDITLGDIAAFRDFRLKTEGVSTGTFILDLKALRCAFNLAKRQGLLLHSPADSLEMPSVCRIEREVFTNAEIRALLSAADQEWRLLILSGYYLGTRISDAAALRWDHVDLVRKLVHYTQAKTGANVVVPIHEELEKELLKLASNDNPRSYLCPSLSKIPVGGRTGLSSQFFRLMETAGVDRQIVQAAKRRFSKKSYHALRHSFASALANAGVSADIRMRLSGHKTFDIHQRYSHFELESLRAGITALPPLGT